MITLNNRIMEHKIINTRNYLLIVNDSEIKEGDWIKWNDKCLKAVDTSYLPTTKKIIAHLPLNNSPILEGVDLLPSLKDEVDKFESFLDREIELGLNTKETIDRIKWYYQQYFKSKQKNYTEEDIKKAFRAGFIQRNEAKPNSCDNLIQSLQQPKMPVGFVLSNKFSTFTENVKNGKYIYE